MTLRWFRFSLSLFDPCQAPWTKFSSSNGFDHFSHSRRSSSHLGIDWSTMVHADAFFDLHQWWTIDEMHLPKAHSSLHKTPNNSTIHRKDYLQWSDWGGEYSEQCDRIVKTAKKNVLERFVRKNSSRSSHFAWNLKRKSSSFYDWSFLCNWLDEKDSLPVTPHHPQSKFPLSSFSFSPHTFRWINTEKRKDPLFFFLVSAKVKTSNNVNGVLISSSNLWRCLVFAMKRFRPEHFDPKRIVRHWKRTEQEKGGIEREKTNSSRHWKCFHRLDETILNCATDGDFFSLFTPTRGENIERNKSLSPIDFIEIVFFDDGRHSFHCKCSFSRSIPIDFRRINRFSRRRRGEWNLFRLYWSISCSNRSKCSDLFQVKEIWETSSSLPSRSSGKKKRKSEMSSFGRRWTNPRTLSPFLFKDILLEKLPRCLSQINGSERHSTRHSKKRFISRREASLSLIDEQLKKETSSAKNNNRSIGWLSLSSPRRTKRYLPRMGVFPTNSNSEQMKDRLPKLSSE